MDLITGERYWRGPIKAAKLETGDRVLEPGVPVEARRISRDGRTIGILSDGAEAIRYLASQTLKIERPEREP